MLEWFGLRAADPLQCGRAGPDGMRPALSRLDALSGPAAAGRGGRLCSRLVALLGLLLGLLAPVQAGTLAVCVSDEAFPPFTFPQHDGESQQRIRLATARQGWQVEFVALPWRRCLAGVQQGLYSAVAGATATAEYLSFMVFPQRAGQPDPRRALGVTRLVVFRPVGGSAEWDGQRFSGLTKPVLYLSGRSALRVLLARVRVPAVDTARNSTQLALMLLKGRGDLAIDHDYQVARLLALPEFQGRFEVLPALLGEAPIYLAVGSQLYQRHGHLVEAIWDEIGALQREAELSPRPPLQAGPPAQPGAIERR